MNCTAVESALNYGENSSNLPSKMSCELETQFEKIDNVFQDVDFTFLDSIISDPTLIMDITNDERTFPINFPKLDNQLICKDQLGMNMSLRAELFRSDIKIHIREFQNNGLTPTKNGLCFTLKTWYRFCQKLCNFNLKYSSASYIANNEVLVLNMYGKMIIQRMDNLQSITLCEEQLNALQQCVNDFNEKLLSFTYELYLPALIADKRRPVIECSEDIEILQARIVSCIETVLATTVFQEEFICEGCVVNHPSQLRHECLKIRDLQKFEHIGEMCLLCVNFNSVVDNFLQNTPSVPLKFVQNFELKFFQSVMYKTPEDI